MSATTTLILGGGFGGISAANTLRGLLGAEHQIVVVDSESRFYVGAGKTWIMLGEKTFEQISQSRAALLAPGIRFVEAAITHIDVANHAVSTNKETLHWDHLIIALGADLNLALIPGLAESAQTFYTVAGAQRLQHTLEKFSAGNIAMLIPKAPFKCPPAPYEAAMLLHHYFAKRKLSDKVKLSFYTVEGAPMATAGPEMGQYIKGELTQREIAYFPQKVTTHIDANAKRIHFEDGSEASFDLLIAIPPHEAPKVVRDAKLTNAAGWIPVDPKTLRVNSAAPSDSIYAIGDVTVLPLPGRYKPEIGLSLPKAGVFAAAQGKTVAHQIAATIRDESDTPQFDGKGYCYLESGAGRAIRAEGSFFAMPHPIMQKQAPDEAQFLDKLAWVEGLLRPIRG